MYTYNTYEDKIRFKKAIDNFVISCGELFDAWEHINEDLLCDDYPFDRDFTEIYYDTFTWRDTCLDNLGIEWTSIVSEKEKRK